MFNHIASAEAKKKYDVRKPLKTLRFCHMVKVKKKSMIMIQEQDALWATR